MPSLTHNLAESCKLHPLDLTKTPLSSERPESCNSLSSSKQRAETPMQCSPGLFYLQYVQFLQKAISHRGYQTATPQRGSRVGAELRSRVRDARLAQGMWCWHRDAAGNAGTGMLEELRRAAAEVDLGCGRHWLCSSWSGSLCQPSQVKRGWGWLCHSLVSSYHWCDVLTFHTMLWTPLG